MYATNALKLLYKIQITIIVDMIHHSKTSLLDFVSNKMDKLIFVKTSLSVRYSSDYFRYSGTKSLKILSIVWFSIISFVVAATMLFNFKPHDVPSTNAHTWSHERTRRHTIAHAQVTCSLIFLRTKERNINYQCVCETFLMSCSLQCQKWYAQRHR